MGIVAFEWNERGNNQLLLLMNRDNLYSRAIRKVGWNDSQTQDNLSGRCEANPALLWLGVSKKGRVAFLVSSTLMRDQIDGLIVPDNYPDIFLREHTSPQQFAENLVLDEHRDEGHVFSLVVADVNCRSMVLIRKPDADESHLIVERVPSGIHSLSIDGLDAGSPRDFRLRDHFERMILGNYGVTTTLLDIPDLFMYDAQGDDAPFLRTVVPDSFGHLQPYGTTSTSVLSMERMRERTWKVMFHERKKVVENDHEYNHTGFIFYTR